MAATAEKIADPALVTSKAVFSVKGEVLPAGAVTFKKKVQDTELSFQITDQTLRDLSKYNGYVVSATRRDGDPSPPFQPADLS